MVGLMLWEKDINAFILSRPLPQPSILSPVLSHQPADKVPRLSGCIRLQFWNISFIIFQLFVQDLWKKGLAPVTKHHSKIISSINSKGQHTPSQLKFEFTGANPPVLCCYTCVEYSPTLYVYMYTPFTAKYINCYQFSWENVIWIYVTCILIWAVIWISPTFTNSRSSRMWLISLRCTIVSGSSRGARLYQGRK